MIDTKALRSKVLDLAIQGKLTQQLESDGTAEELFALIQEKKQKLIKEGKIKKEKALPPVFDEEIPFEIPKNWMWCRLSDLVFLNSGSQYDEIDYGVPYVKVSDMNSESNIIEIVKSKKNVSIKNKGIIPVSSIIFPKRGGAILTNKKRLVLKFPIYIDSNIMAMTMIESNILSYLKYWFDSINLGDLYTGTSIPQINNKDIYPLLIPLPPLAEQKRIVEKVESIFRLLDIIDEAQKKYSADAEILKSKLITMGIQGKLTKQLDSDGTAQELFEQIQKEKQKLIKEGKIKKEKALSPVADEEIPFDIPSNWVWCRFGEVSNIKCTGLVRSGQEQFKQATYYYFKMQNIDNTNGKCNYNRMVMIDASPEEFEKYKLEENDFLFNTRNSIELVGKTAVVHNLPNVNTILNNNILKIGFFGEVNADFVNYFFISEIGKKLLLQFISSTTNVAAIYQRQLITLTIPLPPLAEQKRIADTLDKVLRVISR